MYHSSGLNLLTSVSFIARNVRKTVNTNTTNNLRDKSIFTVHSPLMDEDSEGNLTLTLLIKYIIIKENCVKNLNKWRAKIENRKIKFIRSLI